MHDLDLLLFAERKPSNRRVRIDSDTEKLGQLSEADEGQPPMQRPPRRSAEHEIFQNRQTRHQLQMLENGADAEVEAFPPANRSGPIVRAR